jgi:hypothetical protein
MTNPESSTATVLRMVTQELARDGGAALVTSIKDYVLQFHKVSSKRFNALLVRSNVGKAKLLTFLESHPTVFQVDRSQSPHWVTLLMKPSSRNPNNDSFLNETLKGAEIDAKTQNDLRQQTYDKALLALRKRQARTQRRRQRAAGNDDESLVSTDWVNTHWLLGQCCWELHSYLRACQFYVQAYPSPRHVHPVGCREWEHVVLQKFEEILLSSGNSSNTCRIDFEDGKARLQEYSVQHDTTISTDSNLDTSSGSLDLDRTLTELQLLQEIDRALTDIVVHKDGGHQITLGLLLHRYPNFKQLLGGRDLWQLYQTCANDSETNCLFHDVNMFLSDRYEVILQSKRPKTSVATADEADEDNEDAGKVKRMRVDEEGLFSVTNRKWGRAMANFMIRACKETKLFDEESVQVFESTSSSIPTPLQKTRIAIDLTASVGGMTLGLAKAKYFDRIVALEIDATRAQLCQENMETHGFDHLVEVCQTDSVKQVPLLPRNVCIVIDPPWGGFDYKGLIREEAKKSPDGRPRNHLKLGDVRLEDVLERIAHHNAPCVVGIRLPVNYDVHGMLLECLKERKVGHKSILVRKVGVQFFAVIYFPAP